MGKVVQIIAIALGILAVLCCIIGMAIPVWSNTEVVTSENVDVTTVTYSGLYQKCTRREISADVSCNSWSEVADGFTSGLKATLALSLIGCVFIIATVVLLFFVCCCFENSKIIVGKVAGILAFVAALFFLISVIVYGTEVKTDYDFDVKDLSAGFGLVVVGAVACIAAGVFSLCLD